VGLRKLNPALEKSAYYSTDVIFKKEKITQPFIFTQAENYQAEAVNATHGTSGPIKVSFSRENVNIAENFLEVAAAYDKDRTLTEDTNAFSYCEKYGVNYPPCRSRNFNLTDSFSQNFQRWARYYLPRNGYTERFLIYF